MNYTTPAGPTLADEINRMLEAERASARPKPHFVRVAGCTWRCYAGLGQRKRMQRLFGPSSTKGAGIGMTPQLAQKHLNEMRTELGLTPL